MLLLHGWGQDSGTWEFVVGELSTQYHVYAIDLPGFGDSDDPPSPWTLGRYAQFIQHFSKALHIHPTILVGHSFGARVAAYYASQHSISKLVLASMADDETPSLFRWILTLYAKVRSWDAYIATHQRVNSSYVRNIICPVLLVYGKGDPITPVHIGSNLQSLIPGAQLAVIPRSGHAVHVKRPVEFCRSVLGFLFS